jgi:hypothetical protein
MAKDELLQELAETLSRAQSFLAEIAGGDGGGEATLTLVEVRTALMPIARSGKSDEIRALLQKHGAESLTALDPAKYAALLKEAEVL